MPVIRKCSVRRWIAALLFFTVMLSNSRPAFCQEALRMSLASEQAAELEKRTSVPEYYNVSAGPVKLRFQAEMAVEFNDNVQYSLTNRLADVILSPGVNMRALWPVTEQNSLQFATGIGYVDYLRSSGLSHLYITPDSALVFKMYVDDFVINFHDRFSLIEDVAQNPTISGTGEFGKLENASGFGVDWDLYKLILTFEYDYDLVMATTSNFEYIDHGSELFTLRAAFLLHDTTKLGLELGGGITDYDQPILNNNTEYSIGPFYEAQLSENMNTKLSGGYVSYMFAPNGASNAIVTIPGSVNNVSGYYADLSLSHQVNTWLNQTLSAGRQFQLGVTANLVNLYYVSYKANWSFIRKFNLSTQLMYQYGTTFDGTLQTLDVYTGNVGLSYNITQKLASGVNYGLQLKRANPAIYNYVQNRLVFDFKYSF
jgi:hypothetical protein